MINSTGTCNVDRETVAVIQDRMMGLRCGVLVGSGKEREDWGVQKTVPLGQCVEEEKKLNGPSPFRMEVKAQPGKNGRVFMSYYSLLF